MNNDDEKQLVFTIFLDGKPSPEFQTRTAMGQPAVCDVEPTVRIATIDPDQWEIWGQVKKDDSAV